MNDAEPQEMSLLADFTDAYAKFEAAITDPHDKVYYRSSHKKFLEIVARIESLGPTSILEIGSSSFSILLKQIRPNWRVATWDIGESWKERCTSNQVEFYQGDLLAAEAPLQNESFDVVIMSEVYEHLQGNPHRALEKLYGALRAQGHLILTTPNLARLFNRIKLLAGVTPLDPVGHADTWAGHIREYTRNEVSGALAATGFRVSAADYAMYWDGIEYHLNAGLRGVDESGQFFYRPRFRGLRKIYGYPICWLLQEIARHFPSLRNGMVFVAKKP